MNFSFGKYHGTGNDFIIIDNRAGHFPKDRAVIEQCCHRHYGIGADGLILISGHTDVDFEMEYYNADGRIGSMCGNGGRCAVIFARKAGLCGQVVRFLAFDGLHTAEINATGEVKLSMADVTHVDKDDSGYILDTGSPHLVRFVGDTAIINVQEDGSRIRYSDAYREKGINVNFASRLSGIYTMRTYERGVEAETLSCGTGTVAVAIAASCLSGAMEPWQQYMIKAPGGTLKVYFERRSRHHFTSVFLEGPARHVFDGNYFMEPANLR